MGDENSPNNEANKPVGGSGDNGAMAEQNGTTTMNGNNDGVSSGGGGGGGVSGGGGSNSTTTATSSPVVSSVVAAAATTNGAGMTDGDVIIDQNGHNNAGDNNSVPDNADHQVENGTLNGGPTVSADAVNTGNNDIEEINNESAENADNPVDGGDNNPPGTVGAGDTTDADIDIGGGPPTDTGLLSEGGLSSIIGVGPPSPLTGCYLLIVLGEPHSDDHKDIILQRLIKGLLSWDVSDCHVDLEEELNTITQHAPEGEEARYGERLIQYASENLVTEILIHPQYNTLIQCMRNLLSSFTRHRHIIHSGYTFSGNGSWILQDGTFSVSDFSEAFQEHEVQRVIRAYPDTISTNIHCADSGLWITLPDKTYAKLCKIRVNPNDVLDTSEKINEFIDYLAPMLVPATIHDLLETSDVVGNIRFSHPTLYVFPGGQGDAALFGINGFNMLVDGGFNRKACFWDFARHLDRLDAVLLTRINNSNISGLSSVVERKKDDHVYPQIGHFFCNIPERKSLPSPDGDKDKDPLLIELIERGHNLVSNLKVLNLKPQHCYRDTEPINLYHKVGHGTLDMYVISPSKDSKEVKEFLQKWHSGDNRLFSSKDTKEFNFPLQNLVSICAMLVWQPANPEDTITRILFPGSTPDFKILEGLDRIKHLEFMKYPTCTAKTIAPTIPAVPMIKKSIKTSQFEKTEPPLPSKVVKPMPSVDKQDNKIIDNKHKIVQQPDNKIQESETEIISTKMESKLIEDELKEELVKDELIDDNKHTELISIENDIDNKAMTEKKVEVVIVKPQMNEEIKKEEIDLKSKGKQKTEKPRAEVKPVVRSRIDTKPPKSMERKSLKKDLISDKKSSPTATPQKKEHIKSSLKDKEIKSKVISRISKSSPSSTPAKSAKDANNRKVLESKQKASKIVKREITKTVTEKREIKTERKPISRRPRGTSPSKHVPGSPVKTIKPKSDLRKSRLEKGGTTTDSSLVSTPSADEIPSSKKIPEIENDQDIDPIKQRELDDLKEEQEVVREIEAVFNRDEQKRQKDMKLDHREVGKQDSTTEAEEEEEYLIIEKEEIEQYTEDSINDQESSMTKEEEIQKHQRDSQESEKKRKTSAEEEIEAAIAKAEAAEAEAEAKSRAKKAKEIDVNQQDVGEKLIDERKEDDDRDIQPDSIEEKVNLTSPEKGEIKAEVQDILKSAKEIVKAKTEEIKTEEMSSPTPEEKISSAKKTSDTRDELLDVPDVNKEANLQESLPEEKFSATIESGATTAPTLPEDERIPLDEIKEDLVIEEKYVKEETKEAEVPASPPKTIQQIQQIERTLPGKMQFQTQSNLLRDIVKTPDEVADLPVHEEADIGYDEVTSDGKRKSYAKEEGKSLKEEIAKEEKEVEEIENIREEIRDEEQIVENEESKICLRKLSVEQNKEGEISKEIKVDSIDKSISPEKVISTAVADIAKSQGFRDQYISHSSIDHKLDAKDLMKNEQINNVKIAMPTKEIAENGIQQVTDGDKFNIEIDLKTTKSIADTSEDKKHMLESVPKGSSEPSAPTSEDEVPEQLKSRLKSIEPKDRTDTVSMESPGTIEEIIPVDFSKSRVEKDHVPQEKAKVGIEQVVSTPVHIAEEKEFIIPSEITETYKTQKIESEEKVISQILTTEIATTVKDNIVGNNDETKKIADEIREVTSEFVETDQTKAAEDMFKNIKTNISDVKEAITEETEHSAHTLEETNKILSDKIEHSVQKPEEKVIYLVDNANKEIKEIETEVEKMEDDIFDDIVKAVKDDKREATVTEINQPTKDNTEDTPKIVGIIAKEGEAVKEVYQKPDNIVQVLTGKQEIIKAQQDDISDISPDSLKDEILLDGNKDALETKDHSLMDIPTKTETNLMSVLGGIAKEIASALGKETDETKITKSELTDDQIEKKSSFEITSFTTELRETHITTIDSPVIEEPGHVEDYKILAYEREDSGLNDIKEEEEENRYSPPRKGSTEKLIKIESQPPRPVSPREEEVAKIVANVAQVLKSDKPITEIIPDFDEKQLEEKLLKTVKEVEPTVQRMLVTASSEDGGEEIEICPHGSIKFTPASTPEVLSGKVTPDVAQEFGSDFKEYDDTIKLTSKEYELEQISDEENKVTTKSQPVSEKSSPEHKSASFSIEEKDKIEISEKEQIKDVHTIIIQERAERTDSICSTVEQSLVDRRQSAMSISSEKDITKDESTFDDRPDSGASSELGKISPDFDVGVKIKDGVDKKLEVIEATIILDKKLDQNTRLTEAASHIDENVVSRRESVASINGSKESEKVVDRKPSIVTDTVCLDKKSDEKVRSPSKESSRPASVVSHVDEKEISRKGSASSTQETIESKEFAEQKESLVTHTLFMEKESDERDPSPSKESSRFESVASHADEKDTSRKGSAGSTQETKESEKVVDPKTSIVTDTVSLDKKSDEKELSPSKESSRPESVASHPDETYTSRKGSAASIQETKESEKDVDRKTSIVTDTVSLDKMSDENEQSPSKESSRPESIASHAEEKDASRKSSAASIQETKESVKVVDRKTSIVTDTVSVEKISDKKEHSPSKESSRPESVASHPDETYTSRKGSAASIQETKESEKDVDRKTSIVTDTVSLDKMSDENEQSPSKESSRPESIASHAEEKDASRKSSAASIQETKESEKVVDRKTSIDTDTVSVEKISDKREHSPSKESSRPESVASHADEKDASRKGSAASIQETKESEKVVDRKTSIVTDTVSVEKISDEKEHSSSKETSRPESVASHADEKDASRKGSAASIQETQESEKVVDRKTSIVTDTVSQDKISDENEQSPSKESSRPESIAISDDFSIKGSAVSIQETKESEKVVDRKTSIVTDTVSVEKISDEKDNSPSKESSRPESVASHADEKDASRKASAASIQETIDTDTVSVEKISDNREHSPSKESSRPESVASHADEKDASRKGSAASIQQTKQSEEVVDRKTSIVTDTVSVEKISDDKKHSSSKETSRPESVASHADEKDASRKGSAASIQETKESEKVVDRKTSIVTDTVSQDKISDENEQSPSKESSRPESIASHAEEKAASRKSSASSIQETKESEKVVDRKTSIVTDTVSVDKISDEKELSPPKELSRPESAASHADEKEASRKGSAASIQETKESEKVIDRKTSIVTDTVSVEKISDEKEHSPSKESSRPESAASHAEEKAASRKSSASSIQETKESEKVVDRKTSIVTDTVSVDKISDKKELSPPKEPSRPESAASHADEKEASRKSSAASIQETKESEKVVDRKTSIVTDTVSLDKKTDVKEQSPSKEFSRPESVASHADEKDASRKGSAASIQETKESEKVVDRKPSIVTDTVSVDKISDEKDHSPSKESSRPESVASHADEKDASRKGSAASIQETKESEKIVDQKTSIVTDTVSLDKKTDVKEQSPSKESSRPESVASHADEKDASRKGSAASIQETKEAEKVVDRKPSIVTDTVSVDKISDEKDHSPSKESSRPDSAASHAAEKEASRKGSAASIQETKESEKVVDQKTSMVTDTVSLDKKTDVKEQSPSKESSRPESVASHADEKDASRKGSAASIQETKESEKVVDRKPSIVTDTVSVEKISDEKDHSPSKESSRPESVASHTDEKDASRKASAASIQETKESEKVVDHKTSIVTDTVFLDKKTDVTEQSPSKESSRPESVASHADEKDESRKGSAASIQETKESEKVVDRKPSIVTDTVSVDKISDERDHSPSKESSRPESVASHADEKDASRKGSAASIQETKESEKIVDQKTSIVTDTVSLDKKTDVKEQSPSKESSRPESVASHADEKDASRKGSAASIQETKESEKVVDRKTSIVTDTVSVEKISHKKEHSPSKEPSRPESVASHADEKDSSRKGSAASIQGTKESEKVVDQKTSIVTDTVSVDKISDEKDHSPSKESSRLESVASHADEKDASRKGSAASIQETKESEKIVDQKTSIVTDTVSLDKKTDVKELSPSKESSRPESVASHPDEKDASRKGSAASIQDTKESEKVVDRKPSIVTDTVSLDKKTDVKEQSPSKESSRPESVASHADEKDASRKGSAASIQETKESEKVVDRKTSIVTDTVSVEKISHKKEHSPSKEPSRPESVASHADEKDSSRKGSAASIQETKESEKVVDQKTSIVTDTVSMDKISDEKDHSPSKESSRPESAASHADEKEASRKGSGTSIQETKEAEKVVDRKPSIVTDTVSVDKISDEKDHSPSKESSRPESAASHAAEKEASRKGSAASIQETKESEKVVDQKTSIVTDTESVDKKSDEKEHSLSKESSRPESVASHAEEKHASRKGSASSIQETKESEKIVDQKTSIVTDTESVDKKSDDKEQSPSKESSRPESVASHAEEKDASRKGSAASIKETKESEEVVDKKTSIVTDTESLDKKTDEKEQSPSKESSRPESVASHVDEKGASRKGSAASIQETKESEKVVDLKTSIVTDTESVDKKSDEKEHSPSKESSRPESVASHAEEKHASRKGSAASFQETKESEKVFDQKTSIVTDTESVDKKSDEKEHSPSKESSRPESVASHAEEKHASRKGSAASIQETKESEKIVDQKTSIVTDTESVDKKSDEKEQSPSKESSRPESVTSHAEEKDASRKGSAASIQETKESEEVVDKKTSIVTDTESLDKKTDEKEQSPSKESSRPESVASHVDEKGASRKGSAASIQETKESEKVVDLKTSIVTDTVSLDKKSKEKEHSPSKESSRPESVASHADEKGASRKGSAASIQETKESEKVVDQKTSIVTDTESDFLSVDKKSDEKEQSPSKESSRPESVASHVDEKGASRKGSAASIQETKESEKVVDLKTSIVTDTVSLDKKSEEKEHSPSKESSRPESVASHADEKGASRKGSAASIQETKESEKVVDLKTSIVTDTVSLDKKSEEKEHSPSKESSRPESVASHADEKGASRKGSAASIQETKESEKVVDLKTSIVTDTVSVDKKSEEKEHSPSKESSRPESVESHADEKDASRKGSAASIQETKESEKVVDIKTSIVTDTVSVDKKSEEKEQSPSKESSRPESVASHADEKDASRKRSAASIQETKESEKVVDPKTSIVTDTVFVDKQLDEREPSPSKESSRPASVASHADGKDASRKGSADSTQETKESVTDIVSVDKQSDAKDPSPSKESSRPESVESHFDEKEISRKGSAASTHETTESVEVTVRQESIITDTISLDKKADEKETSISKESSRPASVASHDNEKDASRKVSADSTQETKESVTDTVSLGKQSDAKDPSPSTEFSRPESVASYADATDTSRKGSAASTQETKESVTDTEFVDKKSDEKEVSRPESVESHVDEIETSRKAFAASTHESIEFKEVTERKQHVVTGTVSVDKKEDQQETATSKESSRPESVASETGASTKGSAPSIQETKESVTDTVSVDKKSDEKESSRPESVTSNAAEIDASRKGSAASIQETKESVADTVSVEKEADEKETALSKESSRPESVASHFDEKEISMKASAAGTQQTKESENLVERKTSIVTDTVSVDKKSDEKEPSPPEESSRPESVASHADEKDISRKGSAMSTQETKEAVTDTLSVDKKSDEKESSRPESVTSHAAEADASRKVSAASIQETKESVADTVSVENKADEKETALSKESSRPESVASYADEKDIPIKGSASSTYENTESKDVTERKESIVRNIVSDETKADEKETSPSKESSRPESVESHLDEKETSRKAYAASTEETKESEEVVDRKISIVTDVDKKSDEKEPSPPTESSRPESVASHVDAKEISGNESAASTCGTTESAEVLRREESIVTDTVSAEKKGDEKESSPSKDSSRRASVVSPVGSLGSTQLTKESEEVTDTVSVDKKSFEKVPSPSKESSRSESVASHSDQEEISRKESAASTAETKESEKVAVQKESVVTETDEKTTSPSKDSLRPESVASQTDEKKTPRKQSTTSAHETKESEQVCDRKESILTDVVSVEKKAVEKEISPSRESSRPESVVSHADEKEGSRKGSAASTQETQESEEVTERKTSIVTDAVSVDKTTDEKELSPLKEFSRPESIVSQADDKEISKGESVTCTSETKESGEVDKRKASLITDTVCVDKKTVDKTPLPSKETSPSEAVSSYTLEKEISRKQSAVITKETKESGEVTEQKDSIVTGTVPAVTESDDKVHSESVVSHTDEKDIPRSESVASTEATKESAHISQRKDFSLTEKVSMDKKTDELAPSPSKESCRPDSVGSHADEEEISRKGSATSTHETKESVIVTERKESLFTDTIFMDKKTDGKELSPSKDPSRPESVLSQGDEKEISKSKSVASSPETKESGEVDERKEPFITDTVCVDKKLVEKVPSPSMESSRPESVASSADEKEISRKESSVITKETKESAEVTAQKEPIVTRAVSSDKELDEKAHSPVVSYTDEKVISRRESIASTEATKKSAEISQQKDFSLTEKVSMDKKTDELSPSPSKQSALPDSVSSYADKNKTPKVGSAPIALDTKESEEVTERRESIVTERKSVTSIHETKKSEEAGRRKESMVSETLSLHKKSEEKPPSPSKESSRPESVTSHADEREISRRGSAASTHETIESKEVTEKKADEKETLPSKESSRPESVESHADEKETPRKVSVTGTQETKEYGEVCERKRSIVPEIISVDKKLDEKTPSPSTDSARPQSVASHVDEKDISRKGSTTSTYDTKESGEIIEISGTESLAISIESNQTSKALSMDKKSYEKTPSPSKELSRPESIATHDDDKETSRRVSSASSLDSKENKEDADWKESIISKPVLMDKKSGEKTPSPSKELSPQESVTSQVDEKEKSKKESFISSHASKDVTEDAERKESIISETVSAKEISRSESVASHVQTATSLTSKQTVEIFEQIESTMSKETVDMKSDLKTSSPINELSRPKSIASHVEEKASRSESIASSYKSNETTDRKELTEYSSSVSVATKIKSVATTQETKEHTKEDAGKKAIISEPLLEKKLCDKSPSTSKEIAVASNVDEKETSLRQSVDSGHESIISETLPADKKLDDKIRSPSKIHSCSESVVSHIDGKETSVSTNIYETESINNKSISSSEISLKQKEEIDSSSTVNIQSHQTVTQTSMSNSSNTTETKYKSSQVDKVSFELDSVCRETAKNQPNEKVHSSQPSSDYEDSADDELLAIKDSRSKSIASIMMTSIYKPSDELQHFSTLKEELSESQIPLTEKIISSKSETSSIIQDGISQISISPESDVCRKFSDDDIKETKELKSEIETIVTSYIESTEDFKDDRKTPPTAPVSPNIKAEFTIGSKQTSSQQISSKSISRDAMTTSGTSSPRDLSGKSSPGVTISESRSIPTPADHSSMTGSPDSSPKPTSPFPRVSQDDIKGISTFSTPDVTRTSSPDITEIRNLEQSALTASSEKIITTTVTTITKIISSDGKETVTEEKTITTRDTTDPDEEKVTVTRTRTTSENDKKEEIKLPSTKEITALKTEFRSSTPGSDDFDTNEVQSPRSDISSGQASRVTEDDEIPPSPLSITSHAAHSPPSKFSYEYDLQHSSSGVSKKSDLDIDNSQDDIIPPQYGSEELKSALPVTLAHKIDPMSTSFYGALPDTFGGKSDPIPIQKSTTSITRTYQESLDSNQSGGDSFDQSWKLEKGDHKFLDEADLDFEKALEEHKQVRGEEIMSSVTAKYSYSPSKAAIVDIECSKQQQFPLEDPVVKVKEITSKKQLPVEDLQKPDECSSTSNDQTKYSKSENKDPAKVWGKPLGLPSPAPITNENDLKTTPKKERKLMASKTKFNNEKNLRKRSESPVKGTKKNSPIYMDLTYVPHNGNSYYSHVEFFKKVRARYYVFSGTEPSREVYNALLEAKQTWEDKELEVTIIPTYDTDVLGYWVSENEELLSKYHIDLSPSASRCTINLQDHETSCSAYRLEF